MPDAEPQRPESDEVDSIVAEYLQAESEGRAPDREELIADHPEHADALRSFFQNHDRVGAALAGTPAADSATMPVGEAAASEDPDATAPPPTGSRDSSPAPGTQIRYFGDYELLEEIARGGMGVVYKARQTSLNRIVAVKMILAGQLAGTEEVRRFRAEAEAAAKLKHPGIVAIHEVGDHEGQQYFSMDLIEGASLAELTRAGPLAPDRAAELVEEIAAAVQYAHEQGVIHRDLKPSNILLDSEGAPHVTDFGLAKSIQSDSQLTQSGAVLGTPSYMPPEQAAGQLQEVKETADVYALGAMLYTLLTGRPPFQADSIVETLRQVEEEDPVAPRELNAAIPRDLEWITLKATAKERQRRYPTAGELADDLARHRKHEPVHARPPTVVYRLQRFTRRHRALVFATAAVVATLIAGLAVSTSFYVLSQQALGKARWQSYVANITGADLNLRDGNGTAAGRRLEACPEEHRGWEWHHLNLARDLSLLTLRRHEDRIVGLRFSPDGQVVVSWSSDGLLRASNASNAEELAALRGHDKPITFADFSPDGRYLVTSSLDRTARVWDTRTWRSVAVLADHTDEVAFVSFTPDGERLVTGTGDWSVRVWQVGSWKPLRTLTRPGERPGDSSGQFTLFPYSPSLAFRPDGKTLTVHIFQGAVTWDLESGAFEALESFIRGARAHPDVGWSRGAERVAVFPTDGREIRVLDVSSREALATFPEESGLPSAIDLSPDASRVAVGLESGTLRLWNVASGEVVVTLLGHDRQITAVAYSFDGTRVATGSVDGAVRIWDAESREAAGSLRAKGENENVNENESVLCVAWGPRRIRIATGSRDNIVRAWDAETGEVLATGTGHQGDVISVAFSPDGQTIATGSKDNTIRLWDGRTLASRSTLIGHESWVTAVVYSADGAQIASAAGDKTVRLWQGASGASVAVLRGHTDGVHCVAYSPDSERLVSSSRDRTARVWDAKSGATLVVLEGHERGVHSAAFSPDGHRLATASSDRTVRVWNADDGTLVAVLRGHGHVVNSVAFHPDGTRILSSGSFDRTVRIWHAGTGEALTVLRAPAFVWSVRPSPDGKRIAAAVDAEGVRLWETEAASLRKLWQAMAREARAAERTK